MTVLLTAAVLLAACEVGVSVNNNTTIPVRVIVRSGKTTQVVSPSPGNSSFALVSEGTYRATAIVDSDWIDYAKTKRKVLNDQLANADRLTGPQLLELIRQLKEIAAQMKAYEDAAAGGASCNGRISEDSAGTVSVSQTAAGQLNVICR